MTCAALDSLVSAAIFAPAAWREIQHEIEQHSNAIGCDCIGSFPSIDGNELRVSAFFDLYSDDGQATEVVFVALIRVH